MSRLGFGSSLLMLWTLALIGCTDLTEGQPPAAASAPAAAQAPAATPEAKGRPLLAPTGIASVGEVQAVQNAAGGGSTRAPAANSSPPPAQPTPPAQPSGSIIGKREGRIVDLVESKKNPKVVEVENKVTGSDPLTVSFNAYVAITSRTSVLNFKHQMDIQKEIDGKYPTLQELQKIMKQHKVEVASQPPWQMYGYDQKTGGLVVLEDKGEKIRLYKENKLALEEADKQFDTP